MDNLKILSLRGMSGGMRLLDTTSGAGLPRSLRLLRIGHNDSTQGDVKVGAMTLRELEANQRQRGFERVAIDFDHGSMPGSELYDKVVKAGSVPVILGYGRPRVNTQHGVFIDEIEWTELGQRFGRNLSDVSPAVSFGPDGEVNFIHSVALTPNGALAESEMRQLILNSARSAAGQPALHGRARMQAAFERDNQRTQNLQSSAHARPQLSAHCGHAGCMDMPFAWPRRKRRTLLRERALVRKIGLLARYVPVD